MDEYSNVVQRGVVNRASQCECWRTDSVDGGSLDVTDWALS